MANFATGLNAGLSSALGMYTAIRDENRKSKLFELQAESYNLQNNGRRLDNNFNRDTYDTRVAQEEAELKYTESGISLREQSMRHADELQPYAIGYAKGKQADMRNRAVTSGSDARVALNTEGARTNYEFDRANNIRLTGVKLNDEILHDRELHVPALYKADAEARSAGVDARVAESTEASQVMATRAGTAKSLADADTATYKAESAYQTMLEDQRTLEDDVADNRADRYKSEADASSADTKAVEDRVAALRADAEASLGPNATFADYNAALADKNSVVYKNAIEIARLTEAGTIDRGRGYVLDGAEPLGDGRYVPMVRRPDGVRAPRTVNGTVSGEPGSAEDPVFAMSAEEIANLGLSPKFAAGMAERTAQYQVSDAAARNTVDPAIAANKQTLANLEQDKRLAPEVLSRSNEAAGKLALLESEEVAAREAVDAARATLATRPRDPEAYAAAVEAKSEAEAAYEAARARARNFRAETERDGVITTPEAEAKRGRDIESNMASARATIANLDAQGQQRVAANRVLLDSGVSTDQVVGASLGGLAPGVTPTAATTGRTQVKEQNAVIDGLRKDVTAQAKEFVASRQTGKDREFAQRAAADTVAAVDLAIALNPGLQEAMATAEGANRVRALVNNAANVQLSGGPNAAVVIYGTLGGYGADAIMVGEDIFNNEVWGAKRGVPAAARAQAMQDAMDLVAGGRTPAEAKTAVLRQINRDY